ncbi:MAG: aspartate-alanine antiporter [Lactobacillales bacterium]|jgi:aspartate-alanine antiporter|nr:aspartate-alanine antiporter [Lactobacillales bacterium]
MINDIVQYVQTTFTATPYLPLFIALAIGYAVGSIKFGTFKLGGVAGSLLAGVFVSLACPTGFAIDGGTKNFLFSIFIFAVGYESGPEFFRSLGKKTLKEVALAVTLAVTALATVVGVAKIFDLGKGLAAGVASGGLTQSAIMGVSTDALTKYGLDSADLAKQTANVGVGYAVTYIFGTIGAIIVCAIILPKFMGKGLNDAAIEEEAKNHSAIAFEPGQSYALNNLIGRIYKVTTDSLGTVKDALAKSEQTVTLEKIKRAGKYIDITDDLKLEQDDLILIVGTRDAIVDLAANLGVESYKDAEMNLVMQTQEIVVDKNTTLKELNDQINQEILHGVYLIDVSRMGAKLSLDKNIELKSGDVLKVYGSQSDVDKAIKAIGKGIKASNVTDMCFLALACVLGILIGLLTLKVGGIPLSLGSGGGVLLAGLFFGWLKGKNAAISGSMPGPALQFMKDIGLAGFVAAVGLNSGLQAFVTIREQGFSILFAGLIVTFIPLLITMVVGKYILRYDNSSIFAGALSGSRSANPAFGQVLTVSGNGVPTIPFAVTYALANVFLTILGPLIVAFC